MAAATAAVEMGVFVIPFVIMPLVRTGVAMRDAGAATPVDTLW